VSARARDRDSLVSPRAMQPMSPSDARREFAPSVARTRDLERDDDDDNDDDDETDDRTDESDASTSISISLAPYIPTMPVSTVRFERAEGLCVTCVLTMYL
jgi:hypothetical protein